MKVLVLGSPYQIYILEPYQTVTSIFERELNRIGVPMLALANVWFENYMNRTKLLYPARKINCTVPYRGYVWLAYYRARAEPNRGGKVRFGTDSPLCPQALLLAINWIQPSNVRHKLMPFNVRCLLFFFQLNQIQMSSLLCNTLDRRTIGELQ